jgi:hypothetical protein
MAPLIRFTLLALYLALVLPLPLMAPESLRPLLLVAVPLGLVLVVAITSERVEVDSNGIRVGHPPWCAWVLRRGWQLPWTAITALTPVGTSQGGKVFYVRERAGGAFLLPWHIRARWQAGRARTRRPRPGSDSSGIARNNPRRAAVLTYGPGLSLCAQLPVTLPWRLPTRRTAAAQTGASVDSNERGRVGKLEGTCARHAASSPPAVALSGQCPRWLDQKSRASGPSW